MRAGVFSGEALAPVDGAAGAGPSQPRHGGRRPGPARSPRTEPYVVAAHRREALHRGRRRPRHQGDDPAPDGRAWLRGARPAGLRHRRGDPRARPGRRLLLQRPRRPRHRGRRRSKRFAGSWTRASRSSASASATRSSAGPSAWAPTSCATATAASTSRSRTGAPARWRSPRTTTASPYRRPLEGHLRHAVRPGGGQPRQPQRRLRRGTAPDRPPGLQRPVPPRGRGRPARLRGPVRRLLRVDGTGAGNRDRSGRRGAREAERDHDHEGKQGCLSARTSSRSW